MTRSLILHVANIALCLSLAFIGSCATSPEVNDQDDGYSEEEKRLIIRAKKEMEIGRNMAGRLLRFYGVYNDQKLVRYVNEVGNYVASRSQFAERRFMFDILNTEDINAYACPGGYILLTVGAVRNASSEAELAAVIAHEIAHVGKEHMLNKLASMSEDEMDGKKSGPQKNLPEEVTVRKRPDAEESAAGALLAKYIGGNIAGLNALKAAKAGMSIILEKGLGADLEFEADVEGARYAIDGGYYPYALTDFLCRIHIKKGFSKEDCFDGKPSKKSSKKDSILDKTHPSVPQRIANIMSHLQKIDAKEIVGAKGRKRFKAMKKRLPPAANAKQG
ncbi:M48 family metalloprotease [Pseudobacteriovorax antillogorgiicola]|uniref:Peptidase family M48 n=1 Tax=Pseudobacteriovorax antillogorgiicola TaxID=1513793 RepID=A0A1Y6B8R3_9BACT|nr:M48 family metalloprotease [Pseudobacteriovorax antillogorgiicola]TCS58814.1 peptidase M48-like protein [Pseudobacteriovorax antillogorgiicola]SME94389.1 Peptidase family M48 [Pseudobacteriovorax antillogorgiicola]